MGLPVRRLAANTYMFCMLNKPNNLQEFWYYFYANLYYSKKERKIDFFISFHRDLKDI